MSRTGGKSSGGWSAQHEADSSNRLNHLHRAVIYLAPEPCDVNVDDVVDGRRSREFPPDIPRQGLTRHNLALMAHQLFQQVEFFDCQLDWLSAERHLPPRSVEDQSTRRYSRNLIGSAAPDECAHAGQQLVEGERLDEIIVGPRSRSTRSKVSVVTREYPSSPVRSTTTS